MGTCVDNTLFKFVRGELDVTQHPRSLQMHVHAQLPPNPFKCTLRVKSRIFLELMINEHEIEATIEKLNEMNLMTCHK